MSVHEPHEQTDRQCAKCDTDAEPGSRFCAEHGQPVTDGGQDDWDPEPAGTRDGQATENVHARRQLAQIRKGVESGAIEECEYQAAKERLLEGGEQA